MTRSHIDLKSAGFSTARSTPAVFSSLCKGWPGLAIGCHCYYQDVGKLRPALNISINVMPSTIRCIFYNQGSRLNQAKV